MFAGLLELPNLYDEYRCLLKSKTQNYASRSVGSTGFGQMCLKASQQCSATICQHPHMRLAQSQECGRLLPEPATRTFLINSYPFLPAMPMSLIIMSGLLRAISLNASPAEATTITSAPCCCSTVFKSSCVSESSSTTRIRLSFSFSSSTRHRTLPAITLSLRR